VPWKETEPFQGGESALRGLSSLLGRHARGIVVAADPNSDDTCPAKTRQRLCGECPILVVWRRGIEEVACLDKDARSALDGVGNGGIKASPEAAAPLRPPGWGETWEVSREVIVAGSDYAYRVYAYRV
jgi:hypothetical protein